MRLILLCLVCWIVLEAHSQEEHVWMPYLEQVMTAEAVEDGAWQQTYDLLCDLQQHPININSATRDELEALPFLSAQQVEELMAYLYRYGPMKSLAELQLITTLSKPQCELLRFFVVIGDAPVQRHTTHELITTAHLPLKDGHWFRYQLQYGDRLTVGLVGDQDADEPFMKGSNRWGYDFYSPYLQVKHWGRVETLVVGNYRVSMGMGLVMNNNFSLGKLAMLQNLGRNTNTLRTHSSRTETFLQGVGATIKLNNRLHATAFMSYAPMDATLNADGSARTLLTSGYHRTATELVKKHNMHALKTGGQLQYRYDRLQLGLNVLYTHLDRLLHPNTKQLYNLYKPQGCDFVNVSAHYGYANRRWAFNGETAVDGHGRLATINTLSLTTSYNLTLMALQRFYSYRYVALDAQSYSAGGHVQNESGGYMGIVWQPSPSWQLTAYADYAYFPWVRYRHKGATWSTDYLLQANYTSQRWQLNARYRLKGDTPSHRWRLAAERQWACGLALQAQWDANYLTTEQEWGHWLSGRLAYEHQWLRFQTGVGYYHTDSYNSRVYGYENGPLYTYNLQQYAGKGVRYWLMMRAKINRHLALTAKMGTTNRTDRQHQTDVLLQLRYTLH